MGVVRMFLVCRKGVSRMLQTCWNKCFNWLFKESFDGVSRLFQSLTQEVSRLSQENVVGVSRKFVRCLWCFREASLVPIVFQGYMKGDLVVARQSSQLPKLMEGLFLLQYTLFSNFSSVIIVFTYLLHIVFCFLCKLIIILSFNEEESTPYFR